jgi:lipocalin
MVKDPDLKLYVGRWYEVGSISGKPTRPRWLSFFSREGEVY